MKSRYLISALLASLILIFPSAEGKRVSTRITPPATDHRLETGKIKTYPYQISEFEKVEQALTFMAYDKKTGASLETFFVDNGSDKNLSALELEISYFNSSGKLIHKRTVEITQTFPSKETCKVDISSWDKQKSFHYINSLPSKKGSTSYTVRFRVLSFIIEE